MAEISRDMFDLVDRIVAATSITEIWDVYLRATRSVGLCNGLACFVPRTAGGKFQLIANAMPEGCWESYIDNKLYAGDLVGERVRTSSYTFEWKLSDWDVAAMTPIQKQWRENLARFDLMGGLCVLDFHRDAEIVLGLCGPDGQLHPHDRKALDFSGQEVISRLRELTDATPEAALTLSKRERQCLEWAAAGKTDWEIAAILSLSEKTVNVYIDRAKAKYGVKSRAQAIVQAARAGIITI
jgi:LuxR family quorum sensing-dependent transcriptional regulator